MRLPLVVTAFLAGLLWLGCPDPDDPTPAATTGGLAGTLTFGVSGIDGLYAGPRSQTSILPRLSSDLPEMLAAARAVPGPRVLTTRGNGPRFVASEVIVRVAEPYLPPSEILARVRLPGLSFAYAVNVLPNWHLVRATREGVALTPEETLHLAVAVRALPSVEKAELNAVHHALALPNDNLYKYQWHLRQLQLPSSWDVTQGSESVVVAIVDTGILKHPDLSTRTVPGYDMISDAARALDGDARDGDPTDTGGDAPNSRSSWHGTHVAGTIGAGSNNGQGVSGVDWKCRVMGVRVLGKEGGTLADIASGMAWAVGETIAGAPSNPNPAKVVNLSLGGDGAAQEIYQEAIDLGNKRGAIFVIAAGNEDENTSGKTPANQRDVITVGSVGFTGKKATYSNFGEEVDVVAPGGEMAEDADGDGFPDGILSTYATQDRPPTFKYDYLQGTSMATPHVAGIVALMKAVNGSLTVAQAEKILKDTAVAAYKCDKGCGSGLVNAYAAVLKAKGQIPSGPAELSVTSREIPLGGGNQGVIGVANKGGGSLTVKAKASGDNASRVKFPSGDSKTLSAAQADVLPVEVDGSGLPKGEHLAKVDLDAGAAGKVTVTLTFKVGLTVLSKTTAVGAVYQDPTTGEWKLEAGVKFDSGAVVEYAIEKLPARSYYVAAAVDDNGNGKYFEDGERVGIYPSLDGPEPVPVKAGEVTRKVNFTLIVQGKAPKEETAPARVGAPCTGHSDCGNGGLCDESLAGGYCYKYCPGGDADCPSESSCFGSGDGAVCLVTCTSPAGGQGSCRSSYVCYAAAPKPICLPACKSASDCAEGKSCDSGSGYCQ